MKPTAVARATMAPPSRSNASSMRSKVSVETSTPLPNATTDATARLGGAAYIPTPAPTTSPALARNP